MLLNLPLAIEAMCTFIELERGDNICLPFQSFVIEYANSPLINSDLC
jgi:hypothetical protein